MAKANEWRQRVEEWKASGLTASEFCARRKFKIQLLKTWGWKLGMTSKKAAAPVGAPVQLVKLLRRPKTKDAVRGSGAESSGIRIVAADVSVEVKSGFDRGVLLDVLAVLAQRSEMQR